MAVGDVFGVTSPKIQTTEDKLPQNSSLSIVSVTYVVKEWLGPWWKGACFRKQHQKVVLSDVTMQMKTGQITAVLGNSGSGSRMISEGSTI